MTVLESLDECIKMWTWLAEHPRAEKMDYKPCLLWCHGCALCEYVESNGAGDRTDETICNKGEMCPVSWGCEWCEHPDSPYWKWKEAKYRYNDFEIRRKLYALEVVALAVAAKARLS